PCAVMRARNFGAPGTDGESGEEQVSMTGHARRAEVEVLRDDEREDERDDVVLEGGAAEGSGDAEGREADDSGPDDRGADESDEVSAALHAALRERFGLLGFRGL